MQLVHVLAGQRRNLEHGGISEECQLALHLGLDLKSCLWTDQLPLVQHDDDRTARCINAFRQTLILTRHTDGCVDNEQRDVRVIDRPKGPDE